MRKQYHDRIKWQSLAQPSPTGARWDHAQCCCAHRKQNGVAVMAAVRQFSVVLGGLIGVRVEWMNLKSRAVAFAANIYWVRSVQLAYDVYPQVAGWMRRADPMLAGSTTCKVLGLGSFELRALQAGSIADVGVVQSGMYPLWRTRNVRRFCGAVHVDGGKPC